MVYLSKGIVRTRKMGVISHCWIDFPPNVDKAMLEDESSKALILQKGEIPTHRQESRGTSTVGHYKRKNIRKIQVEKGTERKERAEKQGSFPGSGGRRDLHLQGEPNWGSLPRRREQSYREIGTKPDQQDRTRYMSTTPAARLT